VVILWAMLRWTRNTRSGRAVFAPEPMQATVRFAEGSKTRWHGVAAGLCHTLRFRSHVV